MSRKLVVIAFLGCATSSSPRTFSASVPGAAQGRSWALVGTHPEDYEFSVDKSVAHGGKASGLLKSRSAEAKAFGALSQSIKADDYRGKRLRLSGYVRADGVIGWAGLWMRVDAPKAGQPIALDNMHERPIKGTSDWVRYEVVLDVSSDAAIIVFGALLDGAGQIWVDDLKLEIVDTSVATTGWQTRERQPQNLDFEE